MLALLRFFAVGTTVLPGLADATENSNEVIKLKGPSATFQSQWRELEVWLVLPPSTVGDSFPCSCHNSAYAVIDALQRLRALIWQ
jgi:hypothetical protein